LGLEAPEGIMGSSSYHFYYPNNSQNRSFTSEFMKTYKRRQGPGGSAARCEKKEEGTEKALKDESCCFCF
jgi:hypothetical protein